MRRFIPIILVLLVLITPFVVRLFLGESSSAAPVAGAQTLIVYTPHIEGVRREFAEAFRQSFKAKTGQDVLIDYTSLGTGDIQAVVKDRVVLFDKLGTYNIDVVWGGGDFFFDSQTQMAPYLEGVAIDPAIMAAAFPSKTLNGLPLLDVKNDPPHWYGAALASFGITYNKPVLKYLHIPEPTTWADLKDPRYRNWLIAADPTRSFSAKTAFMAMVERAMADSALRGESEDVGWANGMGMVRQICANARSFVDGSSIVPGIIASGDAAAGMTIDYYGKTEVEAVGDNRLGYVQPAAATITNADPIAMMKGVPPQRRELAKAFIEFVLSRQGQLLWNTRAGKSGGPKSTSLRRLPIMPSLYTDPAALANFVDKDDPFTAAAGFNKSDKREAPTTNILGELIQASCINCLEDLRETRREIWLVKDVKRRKELDDRLGKFPFEMPEAHRRMLEYKAADPVRQLGLMRAWTAEFKAEYQALRAEAAK